jgi:hypothetical protein
MRKNSNDIQKYATYINDVFCVSTIYRYTIIQGMEFWYYETIVWTLAKGQLDLVKLQESAGHTFREALKYHDRIVNIFRYIEQRKFRLLTTRNERRAMSKFVAREQVYYTEEQTEEKRADFALDKLARQLSILIKKHYKDNVEVSSNTLFGATVKEYKLELYVKIGAKNYG